MLSSSVSKALEYFDDDETIETRTFTRQFDRFFDLLDVRCTTEGINKNKPDINPYSDPYDPRLIVSCYM